MSVTADTVYVEMAEDLLRGYKVALDNMRGPKADAKDVLLTAIACALIAIAMRMPERAIP